MQEKPACLQSGLDALLNGCATDAACHAAYPELKAHFYATLDRLQAAPVTVTVTATDERIPVAVDDLKLLNYLFFELQLGHISQLPRQIEALFAGDYTTPAWRWLAYAAAQEQPATPCASCATTDLHPSLMAYAQFMLAPCDFWQTGAAPPTVVTPLPINATPTLLLMGAYDCALPPYLSQPLAANLPNGYHFVLPVGHAVAGSLCGLYLTEQFLTDPTTPPDAACIAQMGVAWSTR